MLFRVSGRFLVSYCVLGSGGHMTPRLQSRNTGNIPFLFVPFVLAARKQQYCTKKKYFPLGTREPEYLSVLYVKFPGHFLTLFMLLLDETLSWPACHW